MRQPEVARLARLLLALLLVLPLLDAGRTMLLSGAFLVEFLAGDAWRPLSRLTAPPVRAPLPVPAAAVDRYAGRAGWPGTPLVLVHGLAPDGKDDPRLGDAAALLARAGFDVAVPTIPGLTRMRLRPDDREPVVRTLATRTAPTVVVGVSVGAGVALLAAAEDRVRDRVRLVVSLGGYADARDLVRYYLTGDYAGDGIRGHRTHDPALVRSFVDANADLLDASARRLLAAAPADVPRELPAVSPDLARLFDALSPVRVLDRVRADLVLVHGRDDVAVPFTESLALFRARPHRSRLVLVGVVAHVEAAQTVTLTAGLSDLARLWSVVYALVSLA